MHAAITLLLLSAIAACARHRGSDIDVSPSASRIDLQSTSPVPADGGSSATVEIVITGPDDIPSADKTVEVYAVGSPAGVTIEQPDPTDSDGRCTATVRSQQAGVVTCRARVQTALGLVEIDGEVDVTFVAAVVRPSASLSSLSVSPEQGIAANGTDTAAVTVTVLGTNGSPLAGHSVTLSASGVGNTLVQPATTTDANGIATGTITTTVAEAKTIAATIDPGPAQVVLSSRPTVTFTGDAENIDTAGSPVTVSGSSFVADGSETATVGITVQDIHGNPVAGRPVTIAVSGTGNTIDQPAQVTDETGTVSAGFQSTVAEEKAVTAIVQTGSGQVALQQKPTVTFVGDVGAIGASSSTVTAVPSSGLVANGVALAQIDVAVRDVNGNPLAGRTVQVAASGSGNVVVQPLAVTNADGLATATLATVVAETKTLTTTVDPGPGQVVLSDNPTATFVSPPSGFSEVLSTVMASPTSLVADGTTVSTVTVTVRDSLSNPVAGRAVAIVSTGSGNIITQPVGTTAANGVATATIAATVAETKTITALVDPGPSQVALLSQATITFQGDPANISAALSTTELSTSQGLVANGIAQSAVTITIRDANGNPVSGRVVQISATGSGNTLTQPLTTTGNDGRATAAIASTAAGAKVLSVTVDPGTQDIVLDSQPVVTFVGDPANISAALSTVVATPATGMIANGSDESVVAVVVRDINGNPLAGLDALIQVGGSGNTIVGASSTTSSLGVASASISTTVAEEKVVTVTIDPGPSQVVLATMPTLSFVADPDNVSGTLSTVVASPESGLLANGLMAATLSIVIRDVNGNLLPGMTVQVGATGTGNVIVQPPAPTSALGEALATVASTVAASKELSVTVSPGAGQVVLSTAPTVTFSASAAIDDGLLAFAADGSTVPRLRNLVGSAASLSAEIAPVLTPPSTGTIRWIRSAYARGIAALGQDEIAAVVVDDGLLCHLHLLEQVLGVWLYVPGVILPDRLAASVRCFDLAVEKSSGDALLVYSDSSALPKYMLRVAGIWSGPLSLPLQPTTGTVEWIRLAARAGTDEIALVWSDSNRDLGVAVWNGALWSVVSGTVLETDLAFDAVSGAIENRCFDAAYAESTGDLHVAWARDGSAGFHTAVRATGGLSWSSPNLVAALTTASEGHLVRLEPEPGSARIAATIASLGGVEAIGAAIYDGSAWTAEGEFGLTLPDWNLGVPGAQPVALGWAGTSGVVVCAWVEDTANRLGHCRWHSSSGWSTPSELVVSGLGSAENLILRSRRASASVTACILGTASSLFAASCASDGTWTILDSGAAAADGLPVVDSVPFDIALR